MIIQIKDGVFDEIIDELIVSILKDQIKEFKKDLKKARPLIFTGDPVKDKQLIREQIKAREVILEYYGA